MCSTVRRRLSVLKRAMHTMTGSAAACTAGVAAMSSISSRKCGVHCWCCSDVLHDISAQVTEKPAMERHRPLPCTFACTSWARRTWRRQRASLPAAVAHRESSTHMLTIGETDVEHRVFSEKSTTSRRVFVVRPKTFIFEVKKQHIDIRPQRKIESQLTPASEATNGQEMKNGQSPKTSCENGRGDGQCEMRPILSRVQCARLCSAQQAICQ